jgi:hypothetical protein
LLGHHYSQQQQTSVLHQGNLQQQYCFDKQEMLSWEQQPAATKTNYNQAKDYFEQIFKATDTYKQNAGGGTTGCTRYKSANQLADYSDKIKERTSSS